MSISCVQLFAIPWTVGHQALLFTGFCRQDYWNGLPCRPPQDLPNPGIPLTAHMAPDLPHLLHQQADSPTAPPGKPRTQWMAGLTHPFPVFIWLSSTQMLQRLIPQDPCLYASLPLLTGKFLTHQPRRCAFEKWVLMELPITEKQEGPKR